ncbi:ferredoxin [Clostridia bacterium]|nr:ferredoxin [Clostridia bacterium]
MSIKIHSDLCIGCGRCCQICPGSLIRLSEQKAKILHPKRCWACASCLKECPVQAISLFLGEDMGGLGAELNIVKENYLLHWIISKTDGSKETITLDSRNANQY